ncbi:1,4-alpha-glucan branching protein domain-containing protein [Egicoccus halophilus]|uniref:1,4-alpha-glucan branching enzyme n=1 Tax=Egicoccus halophilus TaxID=1670830 RepID=A0A8J3AED5_9ACTN|nr:1,4-alpha-glucan branching protein domain-containing protein [Egicoccus halophilus]GGI06144.1 1,4-alpha-glucan branching enzyme [Egicoccus halophilus]
MTPAPSGEFALVLHTHLPLLAGHGVWPVGEEWLFQAWSGSWLPVTRVLERLAEDGRRDVLTLGVTPTVAAQVRDPRLARDLGTWLAGQQWRSEEQRWHRHLGPQVVELATYYWRHFADLLAYHTDVESRGGLTTVWAELARAGVIELLGGPATHPYLPLVPDPAEIDAQLADGLAAQVDWAGERPRGLWAPEMGYRPRGPVADPTAPPLHVDASGSPTLPRRGPPLPGLEEHYAAAGIDHVLLDTATLWRGAGHADRDWVAAEFLTDAEAAQLPERFTGVLIGDSDVAAFPRDLEVGGHVWSAASGYPGDVWYRDFHAHGTFGTQPSWRVTDRHLPSDAKQPYEPAAAAARVQAHAEHFAGVLRKTLAARPDGVVVCAYDTELFGHWWFEGPAWLETLLRRVADDPALTTTTLASRRQRRPPRRRLALPESSWGYAKHHASWVGAATRPMWQTLDDARVRARTALAGGRGVPELREQLARELALLTTSDWPYMVLRGNTADYGERRVRGHADAVAHLADLVEADRGPDAEAERLRAVDRAPTRVDALLAALDPPG